MLMGGVAAFGMLYSTQALLPQIGAEFAVSPTAAALTVSAGTGGLAAAVLAGTWLGDRVGRVRFMRYGLALAVIAQLVSAVMPTLELLVGMRVVLGLGLACFAGLAMGHVGREVHHAGLGLAMGVHVAGTAVGGVLGRLLTAGVSDVSSWRVANLVLGLVAAAAAAAFAALLPRSRQASDNGGEALTRKRPGAWLRPEIWVLAAVPFLLMGGFVALYNYVTYRLAEPPFGLPAGLIGLAFLAYLAGVAASPAAGAAADRFGRRLVGMVCLALMAAGILVTVPDRLWAVVLGLALLTAGFFGAHAVASGWMPVIAVGIGPPASGLYVSAYYAGSSLIGAAAGSAWSAGGWNLTVAVVMALVAAAGLCLATAGALARRG